MKSKSVDKLFIQQLQVPALIGVLPEERRKPQILLVDLEISVNCSVIAAQDQLLQAIDYDRLRKALINFIGRSSYQLLETLAQHTVQYMLSTFKPCYIRLQISKRPARFPDADRVGVVVERKLRDLYAETY